MSALKECAMSQAARMMNRTTKVMMPAYFIVDGGLSRFGM
jgi:hypothetical protein